MAVTNSLSLSNGTYCPTKPDSAADNILANTATTAQLVFDGLTVFFSRHTINSERTKLWLHQRKWDSSTLYKLSDIGKKDMVHRVIGFKSIIDSIWSFNKGNSMTSLLEEHLMLIGQDPTLFTFNEMRQIKFTEHHKIHPLMLAILWFYNIQYNRLLDKPISIVFSELASL